jgi:hypothetical protein
MVLETMRIAVNSLPQGVEWGHRTEQFVSISHRTSVALLDENVGPKC